MARTHSLRFAGDHFAGVALIHCVDRVDVKLILRTAAQVLEQVRRSIAGQSKLLVVGDVGILQFEVQDVGDRGQAGLGGRR